MEFLNIEINEVRFKKILVVSIILIIVYLAFTMSSLLVFKSYTLGPNTSVNSENINTHIDVLEAEGKKIEIAGWAYKEGEAIGTVKSSYVLKNQETGKMYLMRTQMEENINIEEEEHKMAGIHAQCLLFGIPKGWYDIYVLYQNDSEDILAFTLISVEIK
jgi:hypothetical protein